MAAHQTYEEQKRSVVRGLILLGIITLAEVFVALVAKGHIGGTKWEGGMHYLYMLVMVIVSLFKAYYIVSYFMHMAHEAKGLAMSVVLPLCLLVWAIIAFLQEGNSWGARREQVKEKDEQVVTPSTGQKTSGLLVPSTWIYKG